MFCEQCGNELVDEAAFCPQCGTALVKNPNNEQTVIPPTAEVAANIPEAAIPSPTQVNDSTIEGNCPFCGSGASILLSSKKKGIVGFVFLALAATVLLLNLTGLFRGGGIACICFGVIGARYLYKSKVIQVRRCSNCGKDFEVEKK